MKKVKWGVLGTANIFERNMAEGMRLAENCEMYAIAGRSMEKAEAFKEKYGFEKAYGNYDGLLLDPEVEAVYIPLPNNMHGEWAIKALKAKKHVLCEKPMASSEEEARKMFQAAKENGVHLMEAFAYLHSPYTSQVKQEIESGVIGDILYMEASFIILERDAGDIRMRRETLGGCTYDLGVYCTSLILCMLGEEPGKIQAISAFSPEGIDLYTTALLEYPGGAKVRMDCGMVLAAEKGAGTSHFQIHGTKGSMEGLDFRFNDSGELRYAVRGFDGVEEIKTVRVRQNYCLEVEQLGRCIRDGESPAVTEAFTLANARMIDRILESIGY